MKGKVAKVVADVLGQLVERGVIPAEAAPPAGSVPLDLPKRPEHGDFATNVALTIARAAKKNPRDIATALAEALPAAQDSPIASAEIAGPGFVNLRLHP